MAVDFRGGYVPPGVYVSADSSGAVQSIGVQDTVVCLVGTGLGYQIATETISFAAGDTVALRYAGVDLSSVVVTGTQVVSGIPTTVTFVKDDISTPHDYSLPTTGSGHAAVTRLTRTSSGSIAPSSSVTVSYHYVNDDYFALNSFTDSVSFEDVYGQSLDPVTGAIQSPLSFAASIAFQNGANRIYAVALEDTGATVPQKFLDAYALTLPTYEINLIVPLWSTAVDGASTEALAAGLASHLNVANDQGFPRMGIIGVAQGFSGTTPDVVAQAIDERRIIFVWPNSFMYYNPITAATVPVDGFYFAAGCAGVLANQSVNRGLTRSQVRVFSGIPAAVLRSEDLASKNVWSSKGVSVAEVDRERRLVIRQGVTTNVSSVQHREISLVREQDALFTLIQTTLNAADLIGDPITSDTPLTIKGMLAAALETALAQQIIQGYTDLLVRQQVAPGGDPTIIECTFKWQPTYPLNYISVTFTLDLTSGQVSNVDSAGTAA